MIVKRHRVVAAPAGTEPDEGVRVPAGEPVEEFLHALIGAFGRVLSTRLVDSSRLLVGSLEAFGMEAGSGFSLGI